MKTQIIILFLFVSILLLLTLSGCSRQPEKIYITKYKTIVIQPPRQLYEDNIDIPTPPNKYEYVKADPITRERMLTKYVIDLLSVIKKYRIKLNSIDKWYLEMNKSIVSTRGK